VIIVLTIVDVVLIAYLLLLSLRIILGWFAPRSLGKGWDLLVTATDPYLNLFARIRFLRGSLFDFSPIAAILALLVALDLVNQLLDYRRFKLGFLLASMLSAAWFGARFLLLVFLVVWLLRTIPLLFRVAAGSSLWKVLDVIIEPVVAWVMRLFHLGLRSTPTQRLLLTLGLLFAAWLLGEFLLVPNIVTLFQMLPI
jgi:YggT family protein